VSRGSRIFHDRAGTLYNSPQNPCPSCRVRALACTKSSRRLAPGGGEVYKARDTKLGRAVAVKVLPEAFPFDPDRMSRFEREAKVAMAPQPKAALARALLAAWIKKGARVGAKAHLGAVWHRRYLSESEC
jgi:hypothetical protein